jgi:saccharopine dehydrogenase-like NADP-dependent oxidoreductase
MKNIVLFGAGKSAGILIEYLTRVCAERLWNFTIADANAANLKNVITGSSNIKTLQIDVEDTAQRTSLIKSADLVISLLPPFLHILIALDCLSCSKNLLTASYIDNNIQDLAGAVKEKKLFFLYEMGLDPGIDHMSAMQFIHRIQRAGGKILSFKSHTGGLVAPESDNNLWHYKISWNPANVVSAGSSGAIFKENDEIKSVAYQHIFSNARKIDISDIGTFAYYPNRDSLTYIPVYGLETAHTFLRTTLRHPDFCEGWKTIVKAGLTNHEIPIASSVKTVSDWSSPLRSYVNDFNAPLFNELRLFDDTVIPEGYDRSSKILQWILENRWMMTTTDKDMVVMLHEFEYVLGNQNYYLNCSMVVKGENAQKTAMAKTVGLPLGITAKLVLENKINLQGLHIPIIPEIYEPVLRDLEKEGVKFKEQIN